MRPQEADETATITVVAISPASEGKKTGSVKDSNDCWYRVRPAQLQLMQKGSTYTIGYDVLDSGMKLVKDVKLLAQGEFTAVPTIPKTNGVTAPQGQVAPKYHDPKGECIFVQGMLQREIETNRVGTNEEELVERGQLYQRVFRRLFVGE